MAGISHILCQVSHTSYARCLTNPTSTTGAEGKRRWNWLAMVSAVASGLPGGWQPCRSSSASPGQLVPLSAGRLLSTTRPLVPHTPDDPMTPPQPVCSSHTPDDPMTPPQPVCSSHTPDDPMTPPQPVRSSHTPDDLMTPPQPVRSSHTPDDPSTTRPLVPHP